MEKYLLNKMNTILLWFGIIVFLTWLIPLFNLPLLPYIEKIFGISKISGIISTQYMFTTIGAIFVFWYGYKKYEREKELEFIYKIKEIPKESGYEEIILSWVAGYMQSKKGYLSKEYFKILEDYYSTEMTGLISVADNNNLHSIVSKMLMYFNKNEYIRIQLKDLKNFFQKDGSAPLFIKLMDDIEKQNFGDT